MRASFLGSLNADVMQREEAEGMDDKKWSFCEILVHPTY